MTKRNEPASEVDAFLTEMADVIPLPSDPRGRNHSKTPPTSPRTAVASPTSDDLHGLDDEYAVSGISRDELKKLKRGDYAAQDELDLHGLNAADACASAGRFLEESRHRRCRCVCLVHGRGLHSEGNVAVLKPHVRTYLRSHRAVLAYADAPRTVGGAGAVYVLLRK